MNNCNGGSSLNEMNLPPPGTCGAPPEIPTHGLLRLASRLLSLGKGLEGVELIRGLCFGNRIVPSLLSHVGSRRPRIFCGLRNAI